MELEEGGDLFDEEAPAKRQRKKPKGAKKRKTVEEEQEEEEELEPEEVAGLQVTPGRGTLNRKPNVNKHPQRHLEGFLLQCRGASQISHAQGLEPALKAIRCLCPQ